MERSVRIDGGHLTLALFDRLGEVRTGVCPSSYAALEALLRLGPALMEELAVALEGDAEARRCALRALRQIWLGRVIEHRERTLDPDEGAVFAVTEMVRAAVRRCLTIGDPPLRSEAWVTHLLIAR